jgi:Ran GTPase-activating protein (RanGAP) involved in mRNA processing and transport
LDGFALPVKKLKGTDPVERLVFWGKDLGVASAVVIASLISVNGALTSLDISNNPIGDDGVKPICEALKQNGSLKVLDLNARLTSDGKIGPQGAQYLADMLSVNGALTVTDLLGNRLDAESAKVLAEVAKQKGISLCGIRRDQTTADFRGTRLQPPDAILLASDLSQAIVTGALTALNLFSNNLKDEGVSAVCEAIQSNKETKLASLNFGSNGIHPVGANAVAAMVAVTGGLTKMRYVSPQT